MSHAIAAVASTPPTVIIARGPTFGSSPLATIAVTMMARENGRYAMPLFSGE